MIQLAMFAAYVDEPLMTHASALEKIASDMAVNAPVLLTTRKSGLNWPSSGTYGQVTQRSKTNVS